VNCSSIKVQNNIEKKNEKKREFFHATIPVTLLVQQNDQFVLKITDDVL
jgi:hypothetical protein